MTKTTEPDLDGFSPNVAKRLTFILLFCESALSDIGTERFEAFRDNLISSVRKVTSSGAFSGQSGNSPDFDVVSLREAFNRLSYEDKVLMHRVLISSPYVVHQFSSLNQSRMFAKDVLVRLKKREKNASDFSDFGNFLTRNLVRGLGFLCGAAAVLGAVVSGAAVNAGFLGFQEYQGIKDGIYNAFSTGMIIVALEYFGLTPLCELGRQLIDRGAEDAVRRQKSVMSDCRKAVGMLLGTPCAAISAYRSHIKFRRRKAPSAPGVVA